jgi:ankyrin repeat protein
MESKRERIKRESQQKIILDLHEKMVNGDIYYGPFHSMIKYGHNNLAHDLLLLALINGHINSVINLLKNACEYDDYSLSEFLLNQILYPNPQFYQNKSLLLVAIEHKDHNMVRSLLRTGIDVNDKIYYGNTPLSYALIKTTLFTTEILKLLMDYGADPYIPNGRGDNSYQILELTKESIREDVYLKWLDILNSYTEIKEPVSTI